MKKMFAVLKREYLQAVRKKMFIIMTFLLPLLMAAAFTLPSLLMIKGLGEKKVAVLDATGKLREAFAKPLSGVEKSAGLPRRNRDLQALLNVEYVDRSGDASLDAAARPYLDRLAMRRKEGQLDGVLLIPGDALTNPDARLKYYSRTAADFIAQEQLSSIANRAVHRFRLAERGIKPEEIDRVMSNLRIDSVQFSKAGELKNAGAANFMIGFLMMALLIIPSFVYGLEIMRGIIQEKTDRVVELLISSMTPFQLLVGKILGVAAVGLTQISVWMVMGAAAGVFGAATAMMAGINVLQFLRPAIFLYFAIFFILGYLTYVCVYAIGGAVCNSEKEAQQLIAPITLTMMLPWFLMPALITNPDSNLAVGFSLAPVFGPMTMFMRTLVADPSIWHVLLSVATSIATIIAFFWVTAKIFRVGILSYGKRPTIPELWRWLKVA